MKILLEVFRRNRVSVIQVQSIRRIKKFFPKKTMKFSNPIGEDPQHGNPWRKEKKFQCFPGNNCVSVEIQFLEDFHISSSRTEKSKQVFLKILYEGRNLRDVHSIHAIYRIADFIFN